MAHPHDTSQGHRQGDIEPHRKYLAEVPVEITRRRLGMFRLSEDVMNVLPFVCIRGKIEKSKYREWIHPLDPVSIDDLKNWFGVPNEVAMREFNRPRYQAACQCPWGPMKAVDLRLLPMKRHFDFRDLDSEQRVAVRQMANNLLFGPVDIKEANRPPLMGVIQFMLERASSQGVSLLVAPDLIVCPDDRIEFEGISALYFSNILVYGNGEIVTRNHVKIHAYQVRHI